MVGTPLADAAILFVALLFSAVVSSFEAALQSISRQELEERNSDSDTRAAVALKLKSSPEMLRATTKVVVIFALVFCALVAAPYVQSALVHILRVFHAGDDALGDVYEILLTVVLAALLSGIYLVVVTLVARSYGHRRGLALSIRGARFMRIISRLATVPAASVIWLANLLLFNREMKASFLDTIMSEEGLKDILEEGTKSGIIDSTEHELIESIFDFTETTAREIMIPRTEIVAIELGMSADQILQVVVEEGFTRMPVFDESIDNIVGIVYAKDVLSLIQHNDLIILEDIIRPPNYVHETKPISELLRDFQRRHQHLAIVVDEFGGTEGLITMEDILEEIVGEIQDEYDEEEQLVENMGDGSVIIQAKLNISELNERTEFDLPESEDYDTVGGFVTALFGYIPHEDETIRYDDILIQVLKVDERRVVSVWFKHEEPSEAG